MPGTYSKLVTVVTGQTITASERNNEHDNHINNATPTGIDDASSNLAAMQTTADPYPASSESLATDLAGELQRLRYLIAQLTGQAQWYIDPLYAGNSGGDIVVSTAAKGIVLTTPDGLHTHRLAIDNNGVPTTEVVT